MGTVCVTHEDKTFPYRRTVTKSPGALPGDHRPERVTYIFWNPLQTGSSQEPLKNGFPLSLIWWPLNLLGSSVPFEEAEKLKYNTENLRPGVRTPGLGTSEP